MGLPHLSFKPEILDLDLCHSIKYLLPLLIPELLNMSLAKAGSVSVSSQSLTKVVSIYVCSFGWNMELPMPFIVDLNIGGPSYIVLQTLWMNHIISKSVNDWI